MLKIQNKYKNFFSLLKKNAFQYMSSLPAQKSTKNLEDLIKNRLLATFEINPRLKAILEDEDTQDESIKGPQISLF